MIINKMENGIWTSIDTERNEVLCTIESLGNHIYKATNSFLKITAEVFPIDEYRTYAKCIENKNRTKNGIYRKSRKSMLLKNIIGYGTYLFVFLVEKICTSSGIALTYGEFIGQEKYSIFLTMITFLISIPYILSFLLRMIKKFIQVVTGNKSVALIFKPVEALISINVLRYAIYILLFFTSVFTYSVNVSQSDYVFSLVKEALLEFVLLDTVIYSIITNIRDTKKNHKQQNMRRYYVPFKYDLEFVLSAITMHNLKDKEMYARIKFSVDINKILKEKKQNDVSEIDKLLAEISTNYYKTEILEQKTKVVLSRIIDLIG